MIDKRGWVTPALVLSYGFPALCVPFFSSSCPLLFAVFTYSSFSRRGALFYYLPVVFPSRVHLRRLLLFFFPPLHLSAIHQ